MSTMLFGGNTYGVAATYSTYVEYRVDDTTLNPFNYVTIYAGRPSEQTQADSTDVESLLQTVIIDRYNDRYNQPPGSRTNTFTSLTIGDGEVPGGSEVPEPGYGFALFVALVVGVTWRRWRHGSRRHA